MGKWDKARLWDIWACDKTADEDEQIKRQVAKKCVHLCLFSCTLRTEVRSENTLISSQAFYSDQDIIFSHLRIWRLTKEITNQAWWLLHMITDSYYHFTCISLCSEDPQTSFCEQTDIRGTGEYQNAPKRSRMSQGDHRGRQWEEEDMWYVKIEVDKKTWQNPSLFIILSKKPEDLLPFQPYSAVSGATLGRGLMVFDTTVATVLTSVYRGPNRDEQEEAGWISPILPCSLHCLPRDLHKNAQRSKQICIMATLTQWPSVGEPLNLVKVLSLYLKQTKICLNCLFSLSYCILHALLLPDRVWKNSILCIPQQHHTYAGKCFACGFGWSVLLTLNADTFAFWSSTFVYGLS